MKAHQPGLGGQLVRRLGRLAVRFYYPRIEFTGRDQLPADGSVLVCANHANSLLDPVLVGRVCHDVCVILVDLHVAPDAGL